ncbi:ATP-binding cassette domain-containing protein [Labrenzia sp. DG1229]|uniref:ATP-binding cassette domain-containing protein n=1 Tax=Labrenzia sp. DG1229 TaxID=681847 RepID=UPI00048C63CC|nr:ATP-binding cassette domain-containing protein [Labrenzia sp. DG1229]
MSDLIYQLKDLKVSFPDLSQKPLLGTAPRTQVLKGLTFDVAKGDVLGIVGGSGSGKSTLGRTMIRLLEPESGSILFEGSEIAHMNEDDLRPLRKKFQMVFQDPMSSLNPRRQVGGIIAGPMRLQGFDNLSARVNEALEMVGLPKTFTNRYPHELSGGQRQRVGIARAIALRPDFILADEIVSGLDVSSQAQVLNLLEQLVRDLGLTLAFVSHDLSVIRRLCSRILVLHQGEIVENALTANLFSNPQADYTRTLLDAIPLPDPNQVWE